MAKFFGVIGYGETAKTEPGVWEDVIVEKPVYGDVLSNSRSLDESSESVNDDISVGNSLSILADAYANEHFFAMKYVKWMGSLWIVSNVKVERPRLILRLGGIYNGPTFEATEPVGSDSGG